MIIDRQFLSARSIATLRLSNAFLAALVMAVVASCGGGGGGGTSSPPSSNPVPGITSLSPASATAGAAAQTLTINGTNFMSSSTVTYNNVTHTATYVSSTRLTISLSANDQTTAGSYAVVVTNPSPGGGPSNSMNFIVDNPAPAIASLSPSSATAGAAAESLTIDGTGFVSNSTVAFNSVAHAATVISSTELTIGLTAGDLATAGSYPVVVTNPAPGGGASNVVTFTVSAGASGSVSISPASPTAPEGGAQTFVATVVGSSHGVNWSVQEGDAGGSITSTAPDSAVYLAPNAAGTFHVIATSSDNPTQSATATTTVTPPDSLAVLYSFSSVDTGLGPLIRGSDGDFYGTFGFIYSANLGPEADSALVFKVDGVGNLTVLYSFSFGADGGLPAGALLQGSDGSFYGAAAFGGDFDCSLNTIGCGTIFKIDTAGNFSVLHTFSGPDGAFPNGSLIQAADGYLYGTASGGGTSSNYAGGCGVILKMDSSGNVTVLHSVTGAEGSQPGNGIVQGRDGNFYGTTSTGGVANLGTFFQMEASGSVTVLYSFAEPYCASYGGLIHDSEYHRPEPSAAGRPWSKMIGGQLAHAPTAQSHFGAPHAS